MPDTILAFDYGRRRIGVAVGQAITASATPVGTVNNDHSGIDWATIESMIKDWQPSCLVVGMPAHADGSDAEVAQHVRAFMDSLKRFDLRIDSVDERYTSIEAEEMLKAARARGSSRKISKKRIDAAAAVLIAERWLQHIG